MLCSDPHCAQNPNSHEIHEFYRRLSDQCKTLPYRSRKDEFFTVVHWGQRKLLIAEIEFLTICGNEHQSREVDTVVVYAGAAPGTHVKALAKMFPWLQFVLVDPAPFTVSPTDKVKIIQKMFTNELAQELANDIKGQIVFISDVRSADYAIHKDSEKRIKDDMQAQWDWHIRLKAVRSMLKFRLPWDDAKSTYLDGDLHLPVWGPRSTTECRLITDSQKPQKTRVYDHKKYESQMHYFNVTTRPSVYPHDVKAEGLDRCYDCRAEVEILRNYLASTGMHGDVARLSMWISREISKSRTLKDQNPDIETRDKIIKRRQYINGVPAYEKSE